MLKYFAVRSDGADGLGGPSSWQEYRRDREGEPAAGPRRRRAEADGGCGGQDVRPLRARTADDPPGDPPVVEEPEEVGSQPEADGGAAQQGHVGARAEDEGEGEVMAELSHQPTTRGKLYEEFLPSRLPKLLQHRTAFSPPLPYSEWVEYRPEIGVKMCLGTPEFELSDFLENPTSTYSLPTNQAGPDLVGLFSPSRRTNLRYVVTNPSKFFTVRSTGDVLEGYQDHYSRVQKALGNFDGFFRVVVAFRLNIQSKGGKPMKRVPFVKIDSTNADLLIDNKLQNFLRLLLEERITPVGVDKVGRTNVA
ncbi:hypothetical protein BZG36_05534 [Bifiguratus adelaidae]|uniref:Uncharacterized protein n=1 Tax=Bifiguratus adelaidae TaxID=1938954 RepID=A0A261XTU5_9FUNG|nr:hypothetical protein BZG36_05534 [Bifiguratus adelaidae]